MTQTPIDNWTERELRKFKAELSAVQTRVRRIGEDVSWRGLGSKLASIYELPSFETGFIWDIRPFNKELKVYVSSVDHSGRVGPGYRELAIEPAALKRMLTSLAGIRVVPWFPETPHAGLDGTSYSLEIVQGFARVTWSWWSEGPPEWRELACRIRELIAQFKQLEGAPDLLNHPSLAGVT